MAYKRKTWHEKLYDSKQTAHVETTDKKFADVPGGATLLIPDGALVADYINHIPKGVHVSLQQMRKDLAAAHNAQYSCPIVSGIMLRVAAEAAYEEYISGEKPLKNIIPFWRMIDSKAPVSKKLTFGAEFIREQRAKEGLDF